MRMARHGRRAKIEQEHTAHLVGSGAGTGIERMDSPSRLSH